jgi:anti-sigma regulatory factor (Ser/Thr protein kinase)
MLCKRKWTYDCPTHLHELKLFREFVRGVYADPDVIRSAAPDEADRMLLALHEVLVNIIEHAAGEHAPCVSPIRLDVFLHEDRIDWIFAHRMAFFSPGHIPVPDEGGNQTRGYGLYIIEQTADQVRYFQNERGESCVKLVKGFCSARAAEGSGESTT